MRLDGLDPMISWAMGSSTGHTGVALWRGLELLICESNAKSPYWPVNGVQCTLYERWLELAAAADYNLVWAPLDRQLSQELNMTAVWQFVDGMVGVDYGYEVVLTGLLDTLHDNLPCAGSNNTFCVEPEHLEFLFSYIERVSSEASRVLKPAIMQRVGLPSDRPLVEAYYQAHLAGLDGRMVALVPEQDGWLYHTTGFGEPDISPVMICNVFVCNVWKHGGLFSGIENDIQCGETSVNDNYRLQVYSEEPLPGTDIDIVLLSLKLFKCLTSDICKVSDPENPLCQVTGKYQLRLDSEPGVLPR